MAKHADRNPESAERPTPEQQWAKLDARLGPDKGAMLERAKLYMKMDIGSTREYR